ncbi:TnsD family transposase [Variovorax sp. dw_308]|uniref:TnsD family transposase n=1 Tax=Variovorax sp. dw_308 TaxID=2721546 RepID=UPI00210C5537|nr:TnsD family transposase [Variovorax sp. dw_308]
MEGETLYGLCCRYHRVRGGRLASSTCLDLFGHARIGFSHDVPERLETFTERSMGQCGTARSIVMEHSVLGYYMRFRSVGEQSEILSQLQAGGAGATKARLGLLATGIGASHPLRFCRECVRLDLANDGIATWRLVHQLPGVWMCLAHGAPLTAALSKVNGVQRFQWLLPDEVIEQGSYVEPKADLLAEGLLSATAVARDSSDILALDTNVSVDRNRLGATLLEGLKRLNLASPSGRLRSASLVSEMETWSRRVRHLPEGNVLCVAGGAALSLVRSALASNGPPLHPLRYVVLSEWLFGSWREMKVLYDQFETSNLPALSPSPRPARGGQSQRTSTPDQKQRFLKLVEADGLTVSAAAHAIGIDVETGITWASRFGVVVQRRPKRLTAQARQDVLAQLKAGRPKTQIASDHGVSIETVTRVLLCDPDARTDRTLSLRATRLNLARKQIDDAMVRNPDGGVSAIRALAPAAFAYLRRNHREVLRRLCESLPKKSRVKPRLVDWSERDRRFSAQLVILRGSAPVFNAKQLAQRVPGLAVKWGKLDRLPRTKLELKIKDKPFNAHKSISQDKDK